jgi:hypothetical protein
VLTLPVRAAEVVMAEKKMEYSTPKDGERVFVNTTLV